MCQDARTSVIERGVACQGTRTSVIEREVVCERAEVPLDGDGRHEVDLDGILVRLVEFDVVQRLVVLDVPRAVIDRSHGLQHNDTTSQVTHYTSSNDVKHLTDKTRTDVQSAFYIVDVYNYNRDKK